MKSSQNNIPNSQPAPAQEEANIYEDEINLIDYFRVLWKRKYFILVGSILPALIFGVILFFWPRMYKVTYTYDVKDRSIFNVEYRRVYGVRDQNVYGVRDQSVYGVKHQSIYDVSNWNLNQNNYKILLGRFYSAENTNKIKAKLQEYNSEAVKFEVWPSYIDLSKVKTTEAATLEQVRQLKAQLLNMTIMARPKNDVGAIAAVVRDDFENVIPVYLVEERLNGATSKCRARMAGIEENRFSLELSLETNKSALSKLKNIKTGTSKSEGNVTLQFDVGGRSEYLPVEYQIQATESKIIELEENVRANEARYSYYKDLLALNEKLLAELKSKMSSYYTIQQFHSFLTGLVDSYKKKELKDHLSSYIKIIANRISVSAPVTERPRVYAVSRGTAKKSAIVFAISLMISVFVVFLLEGIQKS